MIDDVLTIGGAHGTRRVRLADYLDPRAEESAIAAEYQWIKALRHLEVDGQPFRRRFTFRGDSLWWFAELYLHKQQVVLNIHRTMSALDALLTRERPVDITVVRGGPMVRTLVSQAPGLMASAIRSQGVRRAAGCKRCKWICVRAG